MAVARRALALAAVVAMVAGVPVLLWAIAGWPLPTRIPDWDRVVTALRQGDVAADVVIKVLACAVWVCWAQFVWAFAWELATQLRHPYDPPAERPVPLVPRSVHRPVGRLVAFVLAAGVAAVNTPAPALATLHPTAVAAAGPPPPPPPAGASSEPQLARTDVWVVASGDTVWDIAEAALSDGGRCSEILALNPDVVPRRLRAGHHLLLPPDAAIPDARRPAPLPAPPPPAPPTEPPAATVVVDQPGYLPAEVITIRRGDNLWKLSAGRLDIADGPDRKPTAQQIDEYLDDVVASNTIASGNPSLIYTGEQYTFPAIGEPPAPPVSPVAPDMPSPPPDPDIGTSPEPAVDTSDSVAPAETPESAVTPPTVPAAPVTAATPPSTTVAGPATSIAPRLTAPATSAPSADPQPADDRVGQVVAGITGATVLATGLLLAYRRRRHHASRIGAAALRRQPGHRQAKLLDTLVRAADVPLIRWANHELATLMGRLDPRRVTGTPLAVELSASHGIEMLWDTPQPQAPAPWEATDGGWTWRLGYDPDQPVPRNAEVPPLAGLATVGTRDGNQLLVNLEALGTIAVTGDPTRAENLLRAIVLELVASQELATASCAVVGLTIDGDEHFWRAEHTDPAGAQKRLETQQAGYRQLLASSGLANAFQTRIGDPFDRDVQVVALAAGATDLLHDLEVEPNLGVAVLTLGATPHATATIDIHSDGTATLQPLGLTFVAAGLSAATASEIAVLIDDADPPLRLPPVEDVGEEPASDEPDTVEATALGAIANRAGGLDAADHTWQLPQPSHLVRVLGTPRVDGVNGLGRLELGIITFLACNGGTATPDQVIDAVWSGKAIERGTFLNRLSKTRAAAPGILLPRSSGTRNLALDDGVATDLHLLELAVTRASHVSSTEAIELLRDGLDLVEGVPFDDPSFDWAHDRQHHAHASTLIEKASLQLVGLALEAGDIDTARHACRQGLRGLPLNEPIYCARMRVEAAAGNPGGVRETYNDLVRELADLDDGLSSYGPSPQTTRQYEQLLIERRKLRPTG
jgi:DNA-binding SARP family transcriptional activator